MGTRRRVALRSLAAVLSLTLTACLAVLVMSQSARADEAPGPSRDEPDKGCSTALPWSLPPLGLAVVVLVRARQKR
jgi:hypothetical protein